MSTSHKYTRIVMEIIFFGLAGIFLCDYVLANGGYHTILLYFHPVLLMVSRIFVIVAFIWAGFKALALAANRQWRKSLILITCIALILIGAKLTIKVLAE